jgi:hypothetical protein
MEQKWMVAKHLLDFEDSYPRSTFKTFLECAFLVAEKLLNRNEAQLVRWQVGRLEHEAAKLHRKEYVAVLQDCNERQPGIEPSWYTYLLKIMDFN